MGMLMRGIVVGAIVTVASWLPNPLSSAPKPAEAGARCAAAIGCGGGCTARLANGFCVQVVAGEVQARIGRFPIGPKLKGRCSICECWYVYTSRTGTRRFKRTTDLSCELGAGGITTYGPMAVD